ncbi:MAG: hypothetical protein WCV79_04445 [Candidatus Paceibacterota bacterium]|jgi:hypothetical protein
MSFISKADQLTSSEIDLVSGLNSLAVSGATEAIQKTGINSFANINFGSSGGFTELPATGTVDGSNTVFTFTEKPTYIVLDHAVYKENMGWTWSVGTLTATMSLPPTDDIYGIIA